MTKKIFSGIICIVLALAMAVPVLAASNKDGTPYSLIHYEKNGIVGRFTSRTVTKQVGSETRNCDHGRVGMLDRRLQFQVTEIQGCTGCSYQYTYVQSTYWGSWGCI